MVLAKAEIFSEGTEEMSAFSKEQRIYLGKIIRRHRNFIEMSQKTLGAKTKIDPGHISKIECGEVAISINTLAKISVVLEVPMWQLLKEAEDLQKQTEG